MPIEVVDFKTACEYLTTNTPLSEHHRNELKTKRGFTDETIAKYRLFSGGEALRASITHLPAGIIGLTDKEVKIDDRVVIPYLDISGKAYYIRPHKLGLKGVPLEIYANNLPLNGTLIITEGEFKAMACGQLGYPAIAVPGIGTFAKTNFPKLLKLIKECRITWIYIIFDNEIKDDPALPAYKPEPAKRYDVQYFSYILAKMFEDNGISCKIGRIPDKWLVNGKADLDGALAAGMKKDDLDSIIHNALNYKQYKEGFTGECKEICNEKINARVYNIKERGNRYFVTVKHGKHENDEYISNFTMKIVNTVVNREGLTRDLELINVDGEHSTAYGINPDQLYSVDRFSAFCAAHGNYSWTGNRNQLCNIWEANFSIEEGRRIHEPDCVGYIDDIKGWLFADRIIKETGQEVLADGDTIWLNERTGYRPAPIVVSTGKDGVADGIPVLSTTPFDIQPVIDKLTDTVGRGETKLMLGWIFACRYMELCYKTYGCFPFLFLAGKKGSGKSTIAEWLISFWGIEDVGKMIADTTAVASGRWLGFYSSMPIYFDEYKNTQAIVRKNAFFRSAYNRQSAGKGLKSDYGLREARIRGSLLICGEETPEDPALLSRCVPVSISNALREDNHYDWFTANKRKFSYLIYQQLLHGKPDVFLRVLKESREFFNSQGLDDRMAVHYSVCCAGYAAGVDEDDRDFALWLRDESLRNKVQQDSEGAVETFFADLCALKHRGALKGEYWRIDGDNVYLYFHGLYNIWAEDYKRRRGDVPIKASALRDQLKEEKGIVNPRITARIGVCTFKSIQYSISRITNDDFLNLIDVANYNAETGEQPPATPDTIFDAAS